MTDSNDGGAVTEVLRDEVVSITAEYVAGCLRPATREELQNALADIAHRVRTHPAVVRYEATLDRGVRRD